MRRHHPHPLLSRALGAALLAVVLLAGPALRAQEGWDPFKQATSQIVHPNILLVMDRSGSLSFAAKFTSQDDWGYDQNSNGCMAWSFYYNSNINGSVAVAADYSVSLTWVYLQSARQWWSPSPSKGLGNGYWLKAGTKANGRTVWYFVPPSREAIFKNTLANSITLYEPNVPAGTTTGTDSDGKTYYIFSTEGGPTGGAYYDYALGDWVGYSDTSKAPVPDPNYSTTVAPQDLVGTTSNKVNWGLVIFYGSLQGAESYAEQLQQVNPDDTQQTASVTTIEGYLKPVSQGGLNPSGGTPTTKGLNEAKASLTSTYEADANSACKRPYATLLITDGESNNCNPDGNGWGSACSDTTLSDIAKYPPGRADELFLGGSTSNDSSSECTSTATSPTNVRTFVVGVSSDITSNASAVCELNMDAYFGRTDASAADGGMNYQNDSRLPQNTSGSTSLTNYNPGSGNYAYFANTAGEFAQAVASIIAAAGAGDYSTGAPVVSNNLINSSNIAYISSVTYPAMQGHLYSYDEQVLTKPTLLWDAGQVLENRDLNPSSTTYSPRTILTWDPANPTAKPINLGTTAWNKLPVSIQTLLGNDPNALYFLQGYTGAPATSNGTPVQRMWLLGPIVNSTAAVIAAPQVWTGKSSLPSHVSFEQTYAANHAMIVVGSSDGMLHFFDVADGYEVLAILPPDQLANQEKLYQQYVAGGATATGQLRDSSKHLYGVASSPRFADVYLSTDNAYHTVLLLTEGKGGRSLTGVDITAPYPGRTNVTVPYVTVVNGVPYLKTQTGVNYPTDSNYSSNYPVSILWYKDGALPSASPSSYASLGQSWSVPAMGFSNNGGSTPTFSCILGSGFQPLTAYGNPQAIQLNVQDGSQTGIKDLGNSASGLVHNQAYGAGVLYNATAPYNRPNDLLNLGVVADTDGNIWSVNASNGTMAGLFTQGPSNPLYYTPAVGYYAGYDIYAYASGNFYETSPAVTGTGSTFQANVYLTLVDPAGQKTTMTKSIPISSFTYTDSSGTSHNVPAAAQITSDPMLFIPANSAPSPGMPIKAYFTFYDPDPALGCGGASFLVKMQLDMTLVSGSSIPDEAVNATASYLGTGASSGIAFSGGRIIVAKSAIGSGTAAPQVTSESAPTTINQAPGINAWQELQ